MAVLETLFIVTILVTLALSALAGRVPAPRGGPSNWGRHLAEHVGALPAAAGVVVLGWALTIALMIPIGLGTRATEGYFDRPIYRWVSTHAEGPNSQFGKIMGTLTILGNRNVIEIAVLTALLILGIAYGRRWWIPILSILVAVAMQREAQILLSRLVPRHHPAKLGFGVFPSGGVSRAFAIYGIIAVLAVMLLPQLTTQQHNTTWRRRALTGVILFSVIEAFTRIYLSLHWTTDAISGLILGALLLIVEIAAAQALTQHRIGIHTSTHNWGTRTWAWSG